MRKVSAFFILAAVLASVPLQASLISGEHRVWIRVQHKERNQSEVRIERVYHVNEGTTPRELVLDLGGPALDIMFESVADRETFQATLEGRLSYDIEVDVTNPNVHAINLPEPRPVLAYRDAIDLETPRVSHSLFAPASALKLIQSDRQSLCNRALAAMGIIDAVSL